MYSQNTLSEAYKVQVCIFGGVGRLYIGFTTHGWMKDSSWLINISTSLLKKILQKINIVSLVDIAYQQGLFKDHFE